MQARCAALGLGLLGACADPAPAIRDLRLTAPSGAVELVPVPAEGLAVAWTADVDGDVALAFTLAPDRAGDPVVAVATIDAAAGTTTGRCPARPAAAPAARRGHRRRSRAGHRQRQRDRRHAGRRVRRRGATFTAPTSTATWTSRRPSAGRSASSWRRRRWARPRRASCW
jgi:hypothetical protein